MDERAKLKHLFQHWIEHNSDHVRTYSEWSEKAESFGEHKVSHILKDIADRTGELEDLFRKALNLL
jgi:hypothetical protein